MKRALPKRLPTPQPPTSAEREYFRLIRKYQQAFESLVRQGVKDLYPELKAEIKAETPVEIRMDADAPKSVKKLFALIQGKIDAMFPDTLLRRWAKAMIGHSNTISKRNIKKVMEQVDVDVEPLLKDGELNPYFNNVVDENVALIKSISEDEMPRLKKILMKAINTDMTNESVAKQITERLDVTKSRAKLIAVDQVNKLNGALDQYRQQKLGGRRYVWRTSKDERVAGNPTGLYPNAEPSHWAREGKTYRWDKPPSGGHPKQRPRCRCWAEMVLEDVVQ